MRGPLLISALLFLSAVPPSFARSSQDRASFGNDITVSEGETVGDVACAFCSVRIHGNVKGDVAVLFGSVAIDSNQAISGDVAILGGDLNLGEDGKVGGDVAIAGGRAYLASDAMIHGSRAILPGRLWVLLPLAPLLILIGIIWLIVYLVRKNRYRYPVYPTSRGM
jgi:hypothetical protein